ncbi:NAD(P)-dependent oxidoreductase [Sinomicrobium weinanense]|uniref:NAD(P)H-binding protein n=1 Tax=Sinomicrobium weinanense TaxID=2842200 RepID=A0A926JW39_9FLAO|nr:NAD(P)H-binding protein [Sinomicrobium weinanense]MBC9798258.1 NAD(P)H-binding protein [Sinomicrobium weinanense]MBU3122637.1 NAD(P)H-binding protein [Sinomicrobium weinanense]
MHKNIKIAVIGGTGKSGKYLTRQLTDQGFPIKLLLRNPKNLIINHPNVEIVEGNVANYADVLRLIMDCKAVISTLGLGVPPSEPTIFSQATANVIKAMNVLNVHRYIVITGLSVDTPLDNKGPKTAYGTVWMKKTFPVSTTDKQREYEILTASSVDWTLVRLPLIVQTEESCKVDMSLKDCPGDKISATDLATFLIGQLDSKSFIRKAPFIANI